MDILILSLGSEECLRKMCIDVCEIKLLSTSSSIFEVRILMNF